MAAKNNSSFSLCRIGRDKKLRAIEWIVSSFSEVSLSEVVRRKQSQIERLMGRRHSQKYSRSITPDKRIEMDRKDKNTTRSDTMIGHSSHLLLHKLIDGAHLLFGSLLMAAAAFDRFFSARKWILTNAT